MEYLIPVLLRAMVYPYVQDEAWRRKKEAERENSFSSKKFSMPSSLSLIR
jgi:hypothetical protein